MTLLTCADILAGRAPNDTPVTVKGWVRTRRDSKAGISFVHVSDGSCFHPVQVVAPNTLAQLRERNPHLTAGCAVEATGTHRAVAGERAAVRDAGRRRQGHRLGRRPRLVSDPAEAAHARIPARGRAPAAAHQRDRRRDARPPYDRAGDPPFLRRERLPVGEHADHHVVRRGRRGRALSRLDAGPREPAARCRRQASTSRRTSSAARRFSRSRDSSTSRRTAWRCRRSTRSVRRFAPRTPTPAGTSRSSG